MSRLSVAASDVCVTLRADETILAGLARQGFAHRFGCRRGGCGQCKVDLVQGSVSYRATVADTVLTDAERAGGTALSCRAVPDTDCVIRLRDDVLRRLVPWDLAAGDRAAPTPIGRPKTGGQPRATDPRHNR